jgi:hypothetical protein
MRPAFVTAWLFGMGIITWRSVAQQHHPPIPGTMLAASGFFALLALVSEYEPAAAAAALTAWGVDLAALLNLFPQSPLFGNPGAKQPVTVTTGTQQAPGTTTAGGRG